MAARALTTLSRLSENLRSGRARRRAFLILANSLNNLILPVLNVVISILVVRLASVDLWGEFVQVLIVVQLGAHIISWGNKDYLLREFSQNPAQISRSWQTSLVTRGLLFAGFLPVAVGMGFPVGQTTFILLWCLGTVLDQACDVLILYRKDFIFAILVELAGMAFLVLAIVGWRQNLSQHLLITLFALANIGKGVVLVWRFRRYTLGEPPRMQGKLDLRFFRLALPFFLLGFSGMLQSRIDLYSVNYFLSRREVGQYQVFINFIIYLQSVSAFILMPFVKGIYRLPYEAVIKMAARLLLLGLALLGPALVSIHLLLQWVYRLDLTPDFLVYGGLFVLPTFCYLPIIYALYRLDKQSMVLKINVLGIVGNLLLNLWLLPAMGMVGAVIASAVAQWLMLAAYLWQIWAARSSYALTVPDLP
ncbi:MAG: polysaccharide biosynthesis C-terminal domain-containing protein [Chloroflexi bacterium]|nr:polysaccharide biosynthesis C-terminal domain-containing protein [Chloroflexota bacterium]